MHPFLVTRGATLLAVILLGGCGVLPKVTPDMARHKGPLQIEGAHGPLTVAQSKAVLDSLGERGRGTGVFERHLALEQAIVGTPLVAGNRVVLLEDGEEAYPAMLRAIASATDHVNLETYILEDDATGRRFRDALVERQRAGVQVNLIYDSVGSFGTPDAFFEPLVASGARVLEFNPVNPLTARAGWQVNNRDHRKLLIADGRVAIVGGINISGVYSGGSSRRLPRARPAEPLPWRDTDLQIEGPVVAEFQKLFLGTWTLQKGDPLPERLYFPEQEREGNEVVRAIGSSPNEPYSQIYATLVSAINSAEREVFLTNAYFAPDAQLVAALKDAAARGVDVRLILPGRTDSALIFHAGRSYYTELLRGGVRIFERESALLHAKTVLIDGVWSTVGSTNLDWRSFLHNAELNAVVLGPDFGAQMREMFEADLAESKAITLEQWRRRPWSLRIKERLSRLWAYWL